MQQAEDFRDESKALHALLAPLDAEKFGDTTLFKAWTLNAILQHLYVWNQMAGLQLTNSDELIQQLRAVGKHPHGLRGFENAFLKGLSGPDLLNAWIENVDVTADLYANADPKARLKWAGPDMSARSSITARLMESWAHSQAIYDHLGAVRVNTDRIKNIVILGVNTYNWTYKTRSETPPGPMPYLELTAPSGAIWTYGDVMGEDRITGPAEAFCQTVTQTRNVADTELIVSGPIAIDWMSKAQCFAGPPVAPPLPGTRYRNTA